MSEAAKWYVIHTYSGYENKVAQTILKVVENRKLHDLIPEVRVPTEMVMEKNDKDVLREVERKIFPGYVLVKMVLTDDSWYVVRNTRGVTGFVGPGSKPVPLTDREVAALGVEHGVKAVQADFKVGDRVKISTGPMEGFIGEVKAIDMEEGTVDVSVSMFGRETLATLEIAQVKVTDEY
ncbi:MAG: transcription termination/antitermination factor NusG [Ruminococcus sp.]|nr:transcription termination/antitermination factor NusG [Oscillospiraceae bacterium]MBQ8571950.1 transcription termination/antitermination factor NusG [Ruminococcus sp.]